jgi:anti-sigma B factor antagonist
VADQQAEIQHLGEDLIAASQRNEEKCCIKLAGRITIDSSPDLRLFLLRQLSSLACPVFTIDLAEVTYMDTSGLAVLVGLLKTARQSSKRFQLTGLREKPRYLLEATHVLHLFEEADSPCRA